MITEFEWLQAGHCLSLDALTIKAGRWRVDRYPAGFALFKHPKHGWALFDTGYSEHFFAASKRFPYRLYRFATPVTLLPGESARAQLARRSIRPEEIKTLFLSHLHADHVAGIRDFPQADFVTSRAGFEALHSLRGMAAVRGGFLPDLLPSDFEQRTRWIEEDPDVWGDQSVRMVALPGHAPGQYGARILTDGGEKFLCADACWQSRAYRDLVDLPAFTHALLTYDVPAFRESLRALHQFSRENPEVAIYPSHCSEAFR